MARTYKRDARGRFASGGGGGGGKGSKGSSSGSKSAPAAKPAAKAKGGGAKARPGQKERAEMRAKMNLARGLQSQSSRTKSARTPIVAQRALAFLSKSGPKAKAKSTAPKAKAKSAAAAKPAAKAKGGSTKKPARMTAQQKRDQISSAYSKRAAAIRSSDPASAKLKNRALSPKAESRLARTTEGKRFNAVADRRVRQSMNAEASMSSGKGSKARRRAEAIGAKPKRGAPAGARGGKTGTASQQRKAAKEQQKRQAAFSSKASVGRGAKAAYKAARSAARAEAKSARMGGGKAPKAKGGKRKPRSRK